ncbi:MAG: flotillin family protein [Deltaproteobacteria bacterium]|nr:flotillin family protein [Deltaproteobacteria bacterium]
MGQNPLVLVGIAAGVMVVMLVVLAVALRRLLYVAAPNQILVLSGRPNRLPDGRVVGYRVVIGGRALRLPIVERADVIDGTVMTLAIRIPGAFTRAGGRIDLEATASVAISRDLMVLTNYVERFLGRTREDVALVARETLEGALRAVAAQLTAGELESDRAKVSAVVREEASPELAKLGLEILSLDVGPATPAAPTRVPH